ncbi:hypothetical protein [Bosea vestrisii]|uniref:HTH cro/C1-type domain-containing protein n=1 Tax=Bosea vestrisii TaxID=151416 RepID=A0ABW0HGV4_9HYPH
MPMDEKPVDAKKVRPKGLVIRDKAFAKRLETAVLNNPSAPDGHGRQKWLREQLEGRFRRKVSAEALRKWFAGEARPRPAIMTEIAVILEVDEAWLSLGITPELSLAERRHQNALVTGAVNLVAGMIQMSDGHIAFPDTTDAQVDLYAIIQGRQHSLVIRSMREGAETVPITVPSSHERSIVMCVVQHEATAYSVLRLPSDVISKHGNQKGGYVELAIEPGSNLSIKTDVLPVIKSFANLDGELPIRKRS